MNARTLSLTATALLLMACSRGEKTQAGQQTDTAMAPSSIEAQTKIYRSITGDAPVVQARPLPLPTHDPSALGLKYEVVRNAAELASLWKRLGLAGAPPAVDFPRSNVLFGQFHVGGTARTEFHMDSSTLQVVTLGFGERTELRAVVLPSLPKQIIWTEQRPTPPAP